MGKQTISDVLLEYATTGKLKKDYGGEKHRIYVADFGILHRVWNDGHGLIQFAVKDSDGVLLINELYLNTKPEKKDIESNLKIPYEFVSLGYPDYYEHGLKSIRVIQKERNRKL